MASCCGNASKMGARAAHIIYAILYFLAGVVALLLKYFGSKLFVDFIIQVGCVDSDNNSIPSSGGGLGPLIPSTGESYTVPCAGSQAVYRISFGMLSFYFVCGVVSAIIKPFHNGWWFIKILLYVTAMIYPFFLPSFVLEGYEEAARWFAGLFLVFQMVTYIACAYNMHDAIMSKSEEFTEKQSNATEDDKCMCLNCWTALYLFLCFIGIGGILTGIVFMYITFPCSFLPSFMTSLTLLIAIGVMILCILTKFSRGLLTGVVIACYTTFLCWSALTSNPDTSNITVNGEVKLCNPFLCDPSDPNTSCNVGAMVVGVLFTIVSITYAGFLLADTADSEDTGEKEDHVGNSSSSSPSKTANVPKSVDDEHSNTIPLSRDLNKDGSINAEAKRDLEAAARDAAEEDAEDDEGSCCGCNMPDNVRNALFHLVMCLGSFYLAMLLTNWATYDESMVGSAGTTSMWIKFVSQWLTVALFLWTLIAPLCCPERTFE